MKGIKYNTTPTSLSLSLFFYSKLVMVLKIFYVLRTAVEIEKQYFQPRLTETLVEQMTERFLLRRQRRLRHCLTHMSSEQIQRRWHLRASGCICIGASCLCFCLLADDSELAQGFCQALPVP